MNYGPTAEGSIEIGVLYWLRNKNLADEGNPTAEGQQLFGVSWVVCSPAISCST